MPDANPLEPHLGVVIREHRVNAHLTQEELAYRTGLSRYYIGLLEGGTRSPTLGTLDRIGRALGAAASQLVQDAEARRERSI